MMMLMRMMLIIMEVVVIVDVSKYNVKDKSGCKDLTTKLLIIVFGKYMLIHLMNRGNSG